MRESIQLIINEIPTGLIFDSHFIINELIKRFSDEYLTFISSLTNDSGNITLIAHGNIGKEINRQNNIELVGEAWSENIHKKPSKCTCWRKI